jgi:hypothetical protein
VYAPSPTFKLQETLPDCAIDGRLKVFYAHAWPSSDLFVGMLCMCEQLREAARRSRVLVLRKQLGQMAAATASLQFVPAALGYSACFTEKDRRSAIASIHIPQISLAQKVAQKNTETAWAGEGWR